MNFIKCVWVLLCFTFFNVSITAQSSNDFSSVHLFSNYSMPLSRPEYDVSSSVVYANFNAVDFGIALDYNGLFLRLGYGADLSNKKYGELFMGAGYNFNKGKRIQFPVYANVWFHTNDLDRENRSFELESTSLGASFQTTIYLTNKVSLFGSFNYKHLAKYNVGKREVKPKENMYNLKFGFAYSFVRLRKY